ncbi:MAG: hypothetical protein RIM80_12725 [Alphaproteobacteria bacterium]
MTDANADAVKAAMAVLDAHMAALNARDAAGIAATLHFPHHRLASGRLQTWPTSETYLDDFFARAGEGWSHSAWDRRDVIAAGPDKVHLDVTFTRYRADGAALGQFRSLWIVTKTDGRWAAAFRSSFAA